MDGDAPVDDANSPGPAGDGMDGEEGAPAEEVEENGSTQITQT
jgi:hypothetical protein